ncbi:MAG: DUF362 domain-containing protein [Bacillota bacterium]|nr:DUF362 domain-containing protein [Bacillota bacterium]
MKKMKMLVIYGVLLFLCVTAFIGHYVLNKNGGVSTTKETSTNESSKISTSSKPREHKLTVEEKVALSEQKPDPNPTVGVDRGTDYSKVTRKAIENAGGLKDIIKRDDTVLIKPNLGAWGIAGSSPDDTDYRMVQEIANIAKECGAKKVIVAEGSYSGNMFKDLGYDKIKGVELVDLNQCKKEDCYQLKPKNSITGEAFYIPKVYMDADVVISAAKLKTYDIVGTSLSLKNVFGVPPAELYGSIGGKTILHGFGVENSIVDLNKIRKPDFAVIDGILGGKGPGPAGNDPVKSNIIFAGKDLVATDTEALTFMSFTVDEVKHVKLAAQQGLGICDLNSIKVVGADLNSIKMKFKK